MTEQKSKMSKTILILGGSSGIGKQITPILEEDYEVHSLSSRDCNVLHEEHLNERIADIQPHYVLSLVSYNVDGYLHANPRSLDPIMVNCLGAVNTLQDCISHFRERNYPGKIIMMSSYLSQRPLKGTGVYSASKAFVDSLVKTAALENAKYHITVNSIVAGYFAAGLTFKIRPAMLEDIKSKIPVARLGEVSELASAVKFILNNDYVTGTNLVIDGGMSLV